MHPGDVNILCLKHSSLLILKGEVSIELPLRVFCASLLSIRGMDNYTLKKSQAVVGVAKVGLSCAFAWDFVGGSVAKGTRGIPWINLWHDEERNLFFLRINQEEREERRGEMEGEHNSCHNSPGTSSISINLEEPQEENIL